MAMNPMQQMMMQAQRMQRELAKAQAALAEKEFVVSKNGMVTVTVSGDKVVKSVSIDADAMDPENKEMVEETIVSALNEAFEKIDQENAEIESKITGQRGGFPF